MKFKKGQRVKIISSKMTEHVGWMTSYMTELVGSLHRVDGINQYEKAVMVAGYYWREEDIRPLGSKVPIQEPQLFDVEKLVVEVKL